MACAGLDARSGGQASRPRSHLRPCRTLFNNNKPERTGHDHRTGDGPSRPTSDHQNTHSETRQPLEYVDGDTRRGVDFLGFVQPAQPRAEIFPCLTPPQTSQPQLSFPFARVSARGSGRTLQRYVCLGQASGLRSVVEKGTGKIHRHTRASGHFGGGIRASEGHVSRFLVSVPCRPYAHNKQRGLVVAFREP